MGIHIKQTPRRYKAFHSTITTAKDGVEGLQVVKTGDYDLVLSDYRMSEMTGVDFLSEVSKKYPSTVRINIAGYSDINIVREAIA